VGRVSYKPTVEIKGKIIGVRTLQDRGRIQIPKVIRNKLNLSDQDQVYWIESDGKFYIMKAIQIESGEM